jgi:hypothetical protein
MPMSAVEKAMGSASRTLAPHKGGIIDILENTHGVMVRIDRKGLVGKIDFNSRSEYNIAGVPMGISLDDLRTTVPDMQIGEESKVRRATRFGKKQLPEGELSVRITYDTVYEIEISNPDAEYAEPTAPPDPLVGHRSFLGSRSPREKIPFSAIDLNPFAESPEAHRRSTLAGRARIDSFSL